MHAPPTRAPAPTRHHARAQAAIQFVTEAHPDVAIHVGLIDRAVDAAGKPKQPVMPGMGDIADRLFGTDPDSYATPILGEDGMDDA